ncbi:MAG: tRNA (adenosine(37)-N6)-threonylcarbamoyltransferase complex ATPase subunit type 1 TsaE [Bacillota bacterium]|nr:tRNA (adenosine(37)-N6)-threonylcarbamoyltransferase complex ATPase subunit type 1 TsaE [Bacillota bacterium]
MIKKISQSPGDTYFLGQELAAFCRPNTNILIDGDLAAGKTVFAKGLGAGLGVTGTIKSPSYTLMNSYQGEKMPFYHFDAYNLGGMDDFYALGFDEFLYESGVSLIEWGSVLGDGFPEDNIHIEIIKGSGEDERTITFTACGKEAEEILKEWQNHENTGF